MGVASAQLLARVGKVLVLIAIGIAPQAQFHGIEFQRDREFIHRAFEAIDPGGRAGRAHVGWSRGIEPHEFVHELGVGALVEESAPACVIAREIFKLRRLGDGLMRDRVERSVFRRTEGKTLDRCRPMPEPIHVRARQNEADGALQGQSA